MLKRNAKKVLIIEDHPILRHGIANLINQQPEFSVCGEIDEARLAINAVQTTSPELIVLDVSLKGNSGLEVLKNIKAQFPRVKVLVLSMHDETVFAPRALKAGALGYLMKHESPEKVISALKKISNNEVFLSAEMSNRMLTCFTGNSSFASPIDSLSDRELEVFTLLGQGCGTRDIASKLNLSIKTIESHRAHIKEKLNLKNASELIRHAIEWVKSEKFNMGAEAVAA